MDGGSAPYDVLVVGLGLTGLVAGLTAATLGGRTLLIGKGFGTTHFRSGSLDVLGYLDGKAARSPRLAVAELVSRHPEHPYAIAAEDLEPALELVRSAAAEAGLQLHGGLDANQLVATAAGTLRPSCLLPTSLAADWSGARVLAVGVVGYRDFSPELFAAAFPAAAASHGLQTSVRPAWVELSEPHRHLDSLALARLFDQPAFRADLARQLRTRLAGVDLVVFPAVIGLQDLTAPADLVAKLGVPCVEASTVPPSVPGIRLQRSLEAAIRRRGGRVQVGVTVRAIRAGRRVESLELRAAAHPLRIPAHKVLLASGGLASGGLRFEASGSITETVAGLYVVQPPGSPDTWFSGPLLGNDAQPASMAGVRVDGNLRPLDQFGQAACDDLFAAGGLLAGAARPAERSADGIASATGRRAALEAAA